MTLPAAKTPLACALAALLVAGCGGGSSDDDGGAPDAGAPDVGTPDVGATAPGTAPGATPADDDVPEDEVPAVLGGDGGDGPVLTGTTAGEDDEAVADGEVSGRVVEAVGGAALAGVEVELLRFDDGRGVATATSGPDGGFAFDGLVRSDAYRLTLAVDGYRDETVESVRLPEEDALALEPVRLVSDDNAGDGGLSGTILDAVTGDPVAGLTLRFRRGIEARAGEVVASTDTGADGTYAVSGLEYGNLTCEISGEGFQTVYTTVTVLGGIERPDQNAAVAARPEAGETRIVLTWGSTPDDLDAHLTGPGADGGAPFHVYWDDESADGAELDRDDQTSFGPETITATLDSDAAPYRYSVYNFTGGAATVLSRSEATVRVLRGEGVVAEFFVPNGEGNLWTVFDVVGGEIVPIDTIGTAASSRGDEYFAPDLRTGTTPRRVAVPETKE